VRGRLKTNRDAEARLLLQHFLFGSATNSLTTTAYSIGMGLVCETKLQLPVVLSGVGTISQGRGPLPAEQVGAVFNRPSRLNNRPTHDRDDELQKQVIQGI
jgi:hypothetical protein